MRLTQVQTSGNLLPVAPVSGSIGATSRATATSTKRHATQGDSQLTIFDFKPLSLASRPDWIEVWCQHAFPAHCSFAQLLNAVDLAVMHQKKCGLAIQLPLEYQLWRRLAGGDGLFAHGWIGSIVATRQTENEQRQSSDM